MANMTSGVKEAVSFACAVEALAHSCSSGSNIRLSVLEGNPGKGSGTVQVKKENVREVEGDIPQ